MDNNVMPNVFIPAENVNPFVLECRGLTKRYGQFTALNNLNLGLPRGRIIGLLGPNGSGKSTLLKMIAGILTPTSGQVLIEGMEPSPETKAIVSYLPERPYFSMSMKVGQIIDYFEDFYPDFDRVRAVTMLDGLGINSDVKMRTLSKGTKEKIQLVMVMSRRARLYLLDEPIGGVDPASRDYILRTIIGNYAPDSTVLISTHLIYDIEKVLDDFIFIANGQVFLADTTDNARQKHGKSVDELFREVFRCY